MKIIKYALCAFLFGGLVSSCNFLDKEPYKLSPEKYFNNATEAESFLTGVYAILGQSTFYGENFMYLAGGDDLQHYGGTSTRQPADKGLICANTVSSDLPLLVCGIHCILVLIVPICSWRTLIA